MTAAEKAKELVDKYRKLISFTDFDVSPQDNEKGNASIAKACAIICVDEILDQIDTGNLTAVGEMGRKFAIMYWQSVKNEISKL
jgi:hypothetical protein